MVVELKVLIPSKGFVFSHLGDGDFPVKGFVLSSQKAR
jgi:hypothetical protein